MTSATRRVARHTQDGVATEPEASSSAPAQDPHANTQLVQNLPRPPVREAPLRAAAPHEQAAGVRVANVVRSTANNLAWCSGGVFGVAASNSYSNMINGNFEEMRDGGSTKSQHYHGLAWDRGKIAMGAAAAFGGLKAIESLASLYIQVQAQNRGQGRVQKSERARELGTTEACLDKAIEMVTMPDDDGPGPHLSVGEQTALAKDLLNVITAERSRLPPELWNAASNVGDDAHELVNRLLLAARDRAAQQASTSSAG
ncbi:hypothetical protein KM539_12300 [Xanthomonas translucens pv. poae]|uniref:type III secretion system effector XopAV n=1 Tax=Xanthomonas graminis TaxID=3390026 RepID=UPI0006B33EF9|nr:type III secretion system effector XopAV [Xanthomonas translucens]UKE64005.1 hypothetical protein KM539_12300 [Xanthomonas translucens pv. poae]